MPILSDPRREIFARELAAALNAGVPPSEAADRAGELAKYPLGRSRKTWSANNRKRAQRADVKRRVAELREPGIFKAEKEVEVSTEYLVDKLRGIVEFNRADFLVAPDGQEPRYSLIDVPREKIAAASDIQLEQIMIGRGRNRRLVTIVKDVSVSAQDRIAAAKLMAQLKGLLKEKVEHSGEVGVRHKASDLSDDQLAAIAAGAALPAAAPPA